MAYISNRDLKDRIDNINGAVFAVAACASNMRDTYAFMEAEKSLEMRIEELFSIVGISREFAPVVARVCYMRAVRKKADEYVGLSGSGFRKWFKDDILASFGWTQEKKPAEHKRTIKEGDTVRPMTPEEIAQWQRNRLAKLQAQLAKLEAEMAA